MSASTANVTEPTPGVGLDWALIGRQVTGILRMELRNQLFSRRSFALYFLAFAPVAIMALWAASPVPDKLELSGPIDASRVYAFIFQGYLSTSIFLSCLILFMSLFRGEILEKSLHYYFLSPIRREVLVAGKYAAALIAVVGVFSLGTTALYFLTMSPWGLGELGRYLFNGPGFGHLITYVGIAILACIGYGAIFQLAGQLFKNPVIIAVLLWAWEFLNPFLPSLLKKLSVIFYLKSLLPVPVTAGAFAIQADPIPAWISVPGLLLLTAAVLVLAGWRARRMEISYGTDD